MMHSSLSFPKLITRDGQRFDTHGERAVGLLVMNHSGFDPAINHSHFRRLASKINLSQRRRVERAMALLRDSTCSITEVSLAVGFNSTGTFSRTFKAVVGQSPSTYRGRSHPLQAPDCFVRAWTRPATAAVAAGSSSFGEAAAPTGP